MKHFIGGFSIGTLLALTRLGMAQDSLRTHDDAIGALVFIGIIALAVGGISYGFLP